MREWCGRGKGCMGEGRGRGRDEARLKRGTEGVRKEEKLATCCGGIVAALFPN